MTGTDIAVREGTSQQKAIDDAVRKKRLRSVNMCSRSEHLIELRDDPAALFEEPLRTIFFDLNRKAIEALALEHSECVCLELNNMYHPYGMFLVAEIASQAIEYEAFEEVEELFDAVQYAFSSVLEMEIDVDGVLIRTGTRRPS